MIPVTKQPVRSLCSGKLLLARPIKSRANINKEINNEVCVIDVVDGKTYTRPI